MAKNPQRVTRVDRITAPAPTTLQGATTSRCSRGPWSDFEKGVFRGFVSSIAPSYKPPLHHGEQTRALRGSLLSPDFERSSEERMLLLSSRAAVRVERDGLAERVLTTPRANDVKILKLV